MASTLDYVIFGAAPLAAILAMAYQRLLENLDEIKENWPKHRCNPLYMPFASLIQPEVSTSMNFNQCIGTMGKQVLKVPLDSIQVILGSFLKTIQSVVDSLKKFRDVKKVLTGFMLKMMTMTMGKLTTVISTFSHTVVKMRDVIQRMAGTGVVGLYMAKALFLSLQAFWGLAISIIRGFIFATIAIGIAVILFTFVPLGLGLTLLAFFAAAGGFSTFK